MNQPDDEYGYQNDPHNEHRSDPGDSSRPEPGPDPGRNLDQGRDPEDTPRAGSGGGVPRLRMALVAAAFLALGGLVAFLAFQFRPQPERRQAETAPPLVEVVRVRTEPVALDVGSQGTVEPVTASTLVAQVGGRIVATAGAFADGGSFRRGQVLVEIDPSDYELAVEDARAAVAQAEVAVQREEAEAEVARQEWEDLGRGEPNALVLRKPQLAEARARLAAAGAALERARLNLRRTRISAPYDGRVRAKRADLGQYLAPGTPVADVFATAAAEVRLPVAQEDLAFLPVGIGWSADGGGEAPRAVLAGELGGRRHTWSARVVRTGADIDPRTRMLDVFARVDDPLGLGGGDGGGGGGDGEGDHGAAALPMGLFVEADISGRTAEAAVVLPRRALRTTARSRDAEVMVVDAEDRLHFRKVEVLRAVGDDLVVGAGLADGDRVVVSPIEEAVEGMQVRTEPAPPEAEGPEPPPREGGRL